MTEEIKYDVNNNDNNNGVNNNNETTTCGIDTILEDSFANESIVSVTLYSIDKNCQLLVTYLKQKDEKYFQLCEQLLEMIKKYQNSLTIITECQKETSSLANNKLENHLLYPAIEAVAALAEQIQNLYEHISSLPETERFCPFVRPIISIIEQASKIAKDKLQHLDISSIEPKELSDLESDKHDVKKAVPTNDIEKHRKIERTLVPGLIYKGKVLRQAKVSVYRNNSNQQ